MSRSDSPDILSQIHGRWGLALLSTKYSNYSSSTTFGHLHSRCGKTYRRGLVLWFELLPHLALLCGNIPPRFALLIHIPATCNLSSGCVLITNTFNAVILVTKVYKRLKNMRGIRCASRQLDRELSWFKNWDSEV